MSRKTQSIYACRCCLLVSLAFASTSPYSGVAQGAAMSRTGQAALPASQAASESTAGALLDLNTASRTELRALPGMGDEYVRRIIEGRPYSAKNQLATRGVLPKEAYERIRDRIVAHRLPKS